MQGKKPRSPFLQELDQQCEQSLCWFQQYIQDGLVGCKRARKFYFPEGMRFAFEDEVRFNTMLDKKIQEEDRTASKFKNLKKVTERLETERVNLRIQLMKTQAGNSENAC